MTVSLLCSLQVSPTYNCVDRVGSRMRRFSKDFASASGLEGGPGLCNFHSLPGV